jgi:hypothetical protein
MKLKAYILSCPDREEIRKATLESIRLSDWGGNVAIQNDTGQYPCRQKRLTENMRALLRRVISDAPDYALLLEDDIFVNFHLRSNLQNWRPLRRREIHFASLYNPGVGVFRRFQQQNYFIADPNTVYGAQAFLLSKDCAAYCSDHFDEHIGMQDIRLSRLAARLGPIHYFFPSLVQHVGSVSAWGGCFHSARDFDAYYSVANKQRTYPQISPIGWDRSASELSCQQPRVFGIGLSRTGTTSLNQALNVLGFPSTHMPGSFDQILSHKAATDTSIACQFRFLDRRFPGSRFIYTVRDKESWLQSCERFWRGARLQFTNSLFKSIHCLLYRRIDFHRNAFSRAYDEHHQTILDYFAERSNDLLTLDVCKGDGWPMLCSFLGTDVPSTPFPHRNQSHRGN